MNVSNKNSAAEVLVFTGIFADATTTVIA